VGFCRSLDGARGEASEMMVNLFNQGKGQVMFKISTKLFAGLAIVTMLLLFLQPLIAKTVAPDSTLPNQLISIATAATAPSLEIAILGGKPISVLYMTRAGDTVLARCYPGYQPTLKIRSMGSNPNANIQKEGVVTCQPSS
jgi:hypothetical protein